MGESTAEHESERRQLPRGRRSEDPDLHELAGAFKAGTMLMDRIWKAMKGIAVMVGLVAAVLTWAGFRGYGPGSRISNMEQKLDTIIVLQARKDSSQDARAHLLLRTVQNMSYQSCLKEPDAKPTECAKIFQEDTK